MDRKIIHIDCDCFYAAVEMRDDPSLRDHPIAVGGDPGRRGVISTCNYEARQYGVRSAMASAYAKRLCPQLIIVPPRFTQYKTVSMQIHQIFRQYTDLIEPLSLDEAYLDVSEQLHFKGSATRMAEAMRKQIRMQTGITVSAGVAPNKFLAKIASDWNKPDGLKVIPPKEVDAFTQALPIEKLHGVGKVTAQRLHNMGIKTCADIRQYERFEFINKVGSFGDHLHRLAHGKDDREVKPRTTRKSLSVEHTYATDLPDLNSCHSKLPQLNDELKQRLFNKKQNNAIKKAFIKLKFSDFSTTTMERCIDVPTLDTYKSLCEEAFNRRKSPVRLLGVGVRFMEPKNAPQNQIAFNF